MTAFGVTPKEPDCAKRKLPIDAAPSESSADSVQMPKGAFGSVVPGVADHAARQLAMSAGIMHA